LFGKQVGAATVYTEEYGNNFTTENNAVAPFTARPIIEET
jgi:hypothetical protein